MALIKETTSVCVAPNRKKVKNLSIGEANNAIDKTPAIPKRGIKQGSDINGINKPARKSDPFATLWKKVCTLQ